MFRSLISNAVASEFQYVFNGVGGSSLALSIINTIQGIWSSGFIQPRHEIDSAWSL